MARKKKQKKQQDQPAAAEEPRPPRTPGIFSWGFGIVATALIAGALYVGDLASTGFYYAQLNQKLKQELAETDDLNKVLENPAFLALVENQKTKIDTVLGLHTYIEQGKLAQAKALAEKPQVPDSEAKSQLIEILAKLLDTDSEDVAFTTKREEILLKKIELAKTFLSFGSEFANMLGFEALSESLQSESETVHSTKDAERIKIQFYSSGIFAGLPVIDTMPDDIPNYLRVEQHLNPKNRGWIIKRLVRKNGAAQRSLEDLRERSIPLIESNALLEGEFALIEEEKQQAKSNTSALNDQAEALTRQMLQQLIQPKIDSNTRQTYALVRQYKNQYFEQYVAPYIKQYLGRTLSFELPELTEGGQG